MAVKKEPALSGLHVSLSRRFSRGVSGVFGVLVGPCRVRCRLLASFEYPFGFGAAEENPKYPRNPNGAEKPRGVRVAPVNADQSIAPRIPATSACSHTYSRSR